MRVARLLILLHALLGVRLAHAQELVTLSLSECAGQSWHNAELLACLRAELSRERVVDVHDASAAPLASAAAPLSLEVDCAAMNGRVLLHVRGHGEPGATTRDMNLADVPHNLQARALSLALAELLRSHAKEQRPGDVPEPASASAAPARTTAAHATPGAAAEQAAAMGLPARDVLPPSAAATTHARDASAQPPLATAPAASARPPPRSAARASARTEPTPHPIREQRSLQLSLGPAMRMFLDHSDLLAGAELALQWWLFGIGFEGLLGERSDPLGSARYGLAQGFLSYQPLHGRWGSFSFSAAVRGSAGARWATATAVANVVVDPITVFAWDLAAEAAVAAALSRAWSLRLQLQGGYGAGVRLRADRRDLANLSGWFLGAALTLSLRLAQL